MAPVTFRQVRTVYKEPERMGFIGSIIAGVVAIGTTIASAVIKKKQQEKANAQAVALQRAQELAAAKQVAAINAVNKQTAQILATPAKTASSTPATIAGIDLQKVLTYGVPIALVGITLLKNRKQKTSKSKE